MKLQCDINREAAKISALSSGKIEKHEFLTGEQILFKKQIKTMKDQGIKQAEALKALKPEKIQELESEGLFSKKKKRKIMKLKMKYMKLKKWDEEIKRKDLKYKTNKHKYDFQQFEIIRSFGDNIYTREITLMKLRRINAIF